MDMYEIAIQAKELIDYQNNLLDKIAELRKQYAEARIEYEKQKGAMEVLHRNKTMEFALAPEIREATDPRSGKSNKEWTQFLIDEALEADQEYIKQFTHVYDAQKVMFLAESDQLILAEKLGVSKAQARLISSLLEYSSGE